MVLIPTVQTPNIEYVRLLNHSILFFEAQRAGKLPENNRVSWRHDSTLNDGSDDNIDLTGGYYDAGNYLKFTFPLCYSVFMLSWGGTDYIRGYELANQTYYLKDQIKWATDWLIKAHPEPSTLYVQVGDIKIDNKYFGKVGYTVDTSNIILNFIYGIYPGPDTNIPEPRPSYKITESNFGTDLAAIASTAFSSASVFFNTLWEITHSEEDRLYADLLLSHASQLHLAATTIFPRTKYHDSVDTYGHKYSSSGYMDDLILSGISIYKATKDQSILNQTLSMYRGHDGHNKHTEPLDWDNKWGAIYVLLAEVLMGYTDEQEAIIARIDAENYLDAILNGVTANKTNGGLLFWNEFSKITSNSIAMSTSHLLLSYSSTVLRPLAASVKEPSGILYKADQYGDLAKNQLAYIFGKNPMDQHYVVGEHPNSPKHPRSAPASGFKDLSEALKSPEQLLNTYTIYGALVSGPSQDDSFRDKRLDWSQTEIALDYNAPYQNVLAYQVMFSKEGPFYNATATSSTPLLLLGLHLTSWQFALVIMLPSMAVLTIGVSVFAWHSQRKRDADIEHERAIQMYKERRYSRDRRASSS